MRAAATALATGSAYPPQLPPCKRPRNGGGATAREAAPAQAPHKDRQPEQEHTAQELPAGAELLVLRVAVRLPRASEENEEEMNH